MTTAAPPPAGSLRRAEGVLAIALHRFLGVQLLDRARPAEGIWFPVGPEAANDVGMLHGGVIIALLDVASYLALLPELGPHENAVTHDLMSQLVRAVPSGARVEVRGSVIRRARSVAFLSAEARVDGAVVATGQVTKTIIR